MKLRREEGEGKIAFAVRVVNTHGDYITPAEAFGLVDRRSYRGLTKAKLGAQLSIAFRQNKLDKRRAPRPPGMKGQTPMAYGPIAPKQAELIAEETVKETVSLTANCWHSQASPVTTSCPSLKTCCTTRRCRNSRRSTAACTKQSANSFECNNWRERHEHLRT